MQVRAQAVSLPALNNKYFMTQKKSPLRVIHAAGFFVCE